MKNSIPSYLLSVQSHVAGGCHGRQSREKMYPFPHRVSRMQYQDAIPWRAETLPNPLPCLQKLATVWRVMKPREHEHTQLTMWALLCKSDYPVSRPFMKIKINFSLSFNTPKCVKFTSFQNENRKH